MYSPSAMWKSMGCKGWRKVLSGESDQFISTRYKPLFALKDNESFKSAISNVEIYTKNLGLEYEKTLRYVMSELFYNAMEHGVSVHKKNNRAIPPIVQYTWYKRRDEIQFIIADLGIGIKRHLEQSSMPFADSCEAIIEAIKPGKSGTFGASRPYESKNNAGMGLYISNNIIKKLHSDMHIISYDGSVHISPSDVTHKKLETPWPGTFVWLTVKLNKNSRFTYESTLSELRSAAEREILEKDSSEISKTLLVDIYNYFGRNAEVKPEAIAYRDKYILPAILEGKSIKLDFSGVVSSPHSFLNALLATPVEKLGMTAYKRIKVVNADSDIRETIDYIMDENTSSSH
ncbi:DUF4325 domain-containing protein [Nitratidesulfovibrio sp.]|uniref:STAS-like domain-containing protein n=1 Tax=Nitratidesulfovibrio sp. TaxID=2802297 RepID=UPI0033428BE1